MAQQHTDEQWLDELLLEFGRVCHSAQWVGPLNAKVVEGIKIAKQQILTELHKREAEAQKNGVAWTIGVIDDIHIHGNYDLSAEEDRTFKGIKNTVRDRYKFIVGDDPAPHYPVHAELKSTTNQEPIQ